MLPARVGNKITAPAVAKLVGNDINILSVTADDGGSCEGVDWVLHS